MLCNGKVNTPSQVNDDIIDVSSENTDTLCSEAALDGDQETVDQDALLQCPGEYFEMLLKREASHPRD